MANDLLSTPTSDTRDFINSLRRLADELELYLDLGPDAVKAETVITGWAVARRAVPALIGKMAPDNNRRPRRTLD